MKTDELSAWLLHQRLAKGSTTQVFFLTRERGMVRAFCAGGRGVKKRAILQPFTPLWLTLNERDYGAYVKQVEISAPPQLLAGESLLSGLYLNELLYRALKPEMCDVSLFEAYETALKALMQADNRLMIEIALRRFEQILIVLLGYQISYQHDAQTHQAIVEDSRYLFLPGEGFVLDAQGFLGAHILAMGQDIWDDSHVLKTAKLIMRRAIDHLLDGALIQTRTLYQV
ncbi:MAG: DNA repair protein RecO C-terminal domain-containing protein [Gammaproteobacteria bacterium]|nr:DNA repair protein RecO C-terminal domain-containing protein [Gammaproteobacteria bacterium]